MILTTVEIEKIKDFDEQGFFSSTYLAMDTRLEREVAVKDINVNGKVKDEEIEQFFHEALKLSRSEHPRILPIYFVGFCDTEDNENVIPRVVTKYMKNGTLSSVLKSHYNTGYTFPLDTIIRYAHDIIQSLIHLHSLDILHLDLKASNIFIGNDGKLVVGDFGQSRFLVDGLTVDAENLYPALIPDEFTKKGVVDKTADIYQFGILFYSMCCYDYYRNFLEDDYEIDVEVLKGLFGNPEEKDKDAIKKFGANLKRYKQDVKEGLYADGSNYYNYIPGKIIAIIERCVAHKVENRYNNFYEVQSDLNELVFPSGVSSYSEEIGQNSIVFKKDDVDCIINYEKNEDSKKYRLVPRKNIQEVTRKIKEKVTDRTLRKEILKLADSL
ncbi:protein kinase domain-containing protein [Aquimarina mytili]|uniref:Protein kinase n=1 Tax=Aquimarina mytili TaxID=874423 RepID=A0A937A104_9FLAO|nr:protein kinase [Aquimarina mytili]MBL0684871.1 protein kinase [Aquimarina mytili]